MVAVVMAVAGRRAVVVVRVMTGGLERRHDRAPYRRPLSRSRRSPGRPAWWNAAMGPRSSRLPVLAMAMAAVLAVAAGACRGDDDEGAAARSSSTTADSGSSVAPTTRAGAEPEPVDPTGRGLVCEPVGAAVDEAADVVSAEVSEHVITLDHTELQPGPVLVAMHNAGDRPHELLVVRAPEGLAGLPTTASGALDEDELEIVLDPIGPIGSGDSCEGTFPLEPGTYVFADNGPHTDDDEVESYVAEGMAVEVTVIGG